MSGTTGFQSFSKSVKNNLNCCPLNIVNAIDHSLLGNVPEQDFIVPDDDDLVRQSIELFNRSDFSPNSVKELQRRDGSLISIIKYLEDGLLPKLQRDARRLIIRCSDYILSNSLLYHSRKSKSKRAEKAYTKVSVISPKNTH